MSSSCVWIAIVPQSVEGQLAVKVFMSACLALWLCVDNKSRMSGWLLFPRGVREKKAVAEFATGERNTSRVVLIFIPTKMTVKS